MKVRLWVIIFLAAALAAGCSQSQVRLKGRFAGKDGKTVYLDRILPGNRAVIDSAVIEKGGDFRFRIKLPQGQATIYALRSDGQSITLLISPGDRLNIYSLGNIARNYTVEGSPESERLHELNRLLSQGSHTLDSLLSAFGTVDESERGKVQGDYTRAYYKIKREHLAFIASDPGSLASLYALYQRLPGDAYLFNGDNDIVYYKMVADSVGKSNPDSPYLKALTTGITSAESGAELAQIFQRSLRAEQLSHPELSMPDIYGKTRRLSELDGKVILLDFWSAGEEAARMLNAELRQIYERYHDRGFEIYQVCVDKDKLLWITAVQDQKLPWISVNDLGGERSMAVMAYNVGTIPANYIIAPNGDIVAKNLYGDQLAAQLEKLLTR